MDRIDTKGALLDHATRLIRSRGYTAFSFADLATAIGIRKASIHHHFPAKEDLGVAVVARYTERFLARLAEIDRTDVVTALRRYAALYREGLADGQACLCGMVAAEANAVPPAVAAGVATFFTANQAWLTDLIDAGGRDGVVHTRQPAAALAAALLAALEGAVFVAKGLDDPAAFDRAADAVIGLLLA